MKYNKDEEKSIIDQLRDDHSYYGDYGKKFLSNSDIQYLISRPEQFRSDDNELPQVALVIGSYFHVSILEPHKLDQFEVVDASTRSTKKYKEALEESGEQALLLKSDVELLTKMKDKVLQNKLCEKLIYGDGDNSFEVPGIKEVYGEWWKGKADIIHNKHNLIVDLKTTGDIEKFKYSAKRYNYDSQAYIYSEIFNKDFAFIAVDKKTLQVGLFDCDESFYQSGALKVQKAVENYRKYYGDNPTHDVSQHMVNMTLL